MSSTDVDIREILERLGKRVGQYEVDMNVLQIQNEKLRARVAELEAELEPKDSDEAKAKSNGSKAQKVRVDSD